MHLKNRAVGTGKVHTFSMISQCFVGNPASHRVADLVRHQKTNAVLFEVIVFEPYERHRCGRSLLLR